MAGFVIETVGLNYDFGNQRVVKNLSLQVPKGSIYGFLGPNGAGKTTTIKILLNLLKSQADTVFLFGKELNKNRIAVLKKIGSLVEQPAIYGHLSGKENLINRCILLGVPFAKADEMLRQVGISDAANKKASKYSLGMKQRLGIGLALLADPELLLLDEPTNGLDPNGIIEIRELMIELTEKHNKTILVSSHLLSEVERIATHVGIINHGELKFQGSIADLQGLSTPVLQIECGDIGSAEAVLKNNQANVIDIQGNLISIAYQDKEEAAKWNKALVDEGIPVYSVSTRKKDLEHLFLDITSNK